MSVNEQHDPDRELFGQGLANVVVPMFGGVPATAAIARTAVNVRAGASSRLAAVTHSLVLLVVIFTAAPLVSEIPLPDTPAAIAHARQLLASPDHGRPSPARDFGPLESGPSILNRKGVWDKDENDPHMREGP